MATNKINKEVQANLKKLADGILFRAKNGPRSLYWDKMNSEFKDVPQDGAGCIKMQKKPNEYIFWGVYDVTCDIQWVYNDLGVKLPKVIKTCTTKDVVLK